MKSGAGRSAEGFGRKWAGGAALAGSRGAGGSSSEGCGGAEDRADIAGILQSGEDHEQRSLAGRGSARDVIEASIARLDEGRDTLGMLSIRDAFEKVIGSAENWESEFLAIEVGSETGVMAFAGFRQEHGFDAAAGAECFFGEADAFDTDAAGFGGKSAAKSDAELFQPAIIAASDGPGGRGPGFAGSRHVGEGNKFPLRDAIGCASARLGGVRCYCMARERVIASGAAIRFHLKLGRDQ
jgi:hypothetical protein